MSRHTSQNSCVGVSAPFTGVFLMSQSVSSRFFVSSGGKQESSLPMAQWFVWLSEMGRGNSVQSERDEVVVNYFVLCDQVITEAQTSKQSLIGVYSALMAEQIPMHANLAVALGIRVQSSRDR